MSTESGTSGWRVESAELLLRDYWNRSGLDQLLGQPSGSGWSRSIAGSEWNVSPHNMYLTMLVGSGLAGLALFVVLLASATRRAARSGPVMLALVAAMWMFSFGYQLPVESGLIIGLALVGGHAAAQASRQSGGDVRKAAVQLSRLLPAAPSPTPSNRRPVGSRDHA